MKTATALSLAALCASMVSAGVIDKRDVVTTVEWVTTTVTVTSSPSDQTVEATSDGASPGSTDDGKGYGWGNWGGWHGGEGGRSGGKGWDQNGSDTPAATSTEAAATSSETLPSATPTSTEALSSGSPISSSSVPTTSEVAAPTSLPSPPSAASSATSAWQQAVLDAHNPHRLNHTAPPFTWNNTLTAFAAEIAASCVYAHSRSAGDGNYGQNIGAGAPDSDTPKMINDQMYNDEMMYYPGYGAEPDMTNFETWGHFSQIVWRDTVSVGCAVQHCPNGLGNVGSNTSPYFTVCNYYPSGKSLHSLTQRPPLTDVQETWEVDILPTS
jgi:hypothetical protein